MSNTGVADLAYRLLSTVVEETNDLEGVLALKDLFLKFEGDPGFNASLEYRQRAQTALTRRLAKLRGQSEP